MKLKFFILAVVILGSSLFATTTNSGYKTRFDRTQVIKDVNAQQMDKYEHDNFQVIEPQALFGILSALMLKKADNFFVSGYFMYV